ncbi:transglutaminase TgpA family protein [Natronolimnohabitans innermongolicus]|uniref:Transglutaminase n=1 Tax=Natronolimnohabitans innermongolicus JCM 12255 TaxID=1227499 RepID=L9WYM2_9EURY|nr:DUF3488 and transglutaminase-like domain-containing protein [Natronolimnohabitans innermongolicus]ELY54286.1 transglutaminase [Natronolimnohabitans innermongolicus JCM 12255]
MSTRTESSSGGADSHAGDRTLPFDLDDAAGPGLFRLLACCCILVLTASYVSVLREVTRAVGGTETLFGLVVAMLLAATVLAWAIRPRTATVLAVVGGAGGFAYYLEQSGVGVEIVLSAGDAIAADTLALVTGLPLIRMVEAGTWALAFVPAPVFLSWYLAVRGRYGLAAVPGGLALVFLVLTGDAGSTVTLIGTLAAVAAVGFGELERRGGSVAQADVLAVLFALIIVLSLTVTFVPTGPGTAGQVAGGDDGTLEGTIDYASERSGIGGSVDLSPEVRFTVESEQASYWRTGVYDRFTGDEWVRTGEHADYEGPIEEPPGDAERLEQRFTAETDLGVMPAAPQPVALEGDLAEHAEVSQQGQFHPSTPVLEGDTYLVESAILEPDSSALRTAETDYPEEIESRYLQEPEGVSSEFEARTETITEDAETPYEKAVAIEEYLRSSKEYSLEVDRPDGNVAEEFLFEMNEGYCVYFATTMAQMLRAEDVPTRYVTGYTAGQEVDDDEYVVRGTDAHAWVEVYFPDHGWVAFEPTPSGPRDDVHTDAVQQARSDGAENVDTDSSEDVPVDDEDDSEPDDGPDETPTDDPDERPDQNETEPDPTEPQDPENESEGNETEPDGPDPNEDDPGPENETVEGEDEGSDWRSTLLELATVSREVAAVGLVVLVGLAASVHRTGASGRLRRTLGCYWQRPTDDPNRDVERAYRRLERVLAREHRPRKRSESARRYLESIAAGDRDGKASDDGSSGPGDGGTEPTVESQTVDPRLEAVLERYERARYGGGVDRETADETIAIVDELTRERLPILGRGRN